MFLLDWTAFYYINFFFLKAIGMHFTVRCSCFCVHSLCVKESAESLTPTVFDSSDKISDFLLETMAKTTTAILSVQQSDFFCEKHFLKRQKSGLC